MTETPTPQKIESLLAELYAAESLSPVKIKRDTFEPFLKTTINGDDTIDHLVVIAQLDDKRAGFLIYVLTNHRLIKIEIDSKEAQSSSAFLKQIVSFNRTLTNKEQAQIEIVFPQAKYGLLYPANTPQVESFFQKVEAEAQKCKTP